MIFLISFLLLTACRNECEEIVWSSAHQTFPKFVQLLDLREFRFRLILGLVVSVGGLTEKTVRLSVIYFVGIVFRGVYTVISPNRYCGCRPSSEHHKDRGTGSFYKRPDLLALFWASCDIQVLHVHNRNLVLNNWNFR